VPFYFYVGLAIRRAGADSFERCSQAPLLERNAVDPYLTASPWVLREDDGRWRMWYVSCHDWRWHDGAAQHRYHIRYAESDDGLRWRREGRVAIDFADDDEYALSRPCVVRDGDRYRMWFAARGERYRLGYAESEDGIEWHRDDGGAGLTASAQGWDAEMVEYPAVLDHEGRRYLLYNGNGYGRTGIGYAVAGEGAP
jgi:GH43 family beta-xylosidase